jgi:DNA recombination protein RmuC
VDIIIGNIGIFLFGMLSASLLLGAYIAYQRQNMQFRLTQVQHDFQRLQQEWHVSQERLKELVNINKILEISQAKLQQKWQDSEQYQQEQVIHHDKMLMQAKAAIFDAGKQLSQSLMEEHQRHSQHYMQQQEQSFGQQSHIIQEQMTRLSQSVHTLHHQVTDQQQQMQHWQRMLTAPVGAGLMGEVTLENIFRIAGLSRGRDYILQWHGTKFQEDHVGSTRIRPDAVVFLPQSHVLVIDSKASSSFFNFYHNAEIALPDQGIDASIHDNIQRQIKLMTSKSYREIVKQQLEQEYNYKLEHISLLMFIPSDALLSRLQQHNPTFLEECWKMQLFPVGPTGLMHIIAQSRFYISEALRYENHVHILTEVQKLLSTIQTLHGHARKLGQSLSQAAQHYDKFAASFNSNLLMRARRVEQLGIDMPSDKSMPAALARLHVVNKEDDEYTNTTSSSVDDENQSVTS